jgi:predicted metalloprotease
VGRASRAALSLVLLLGLVTGCAQAVNGIGTISLQVQGDSGGAFDTQAKAALLDVMGFWATTYPEIANGKPLPPLRGKLYSVDGDAVVRTRQPPPSASANKCLQQKLSFIVDNAAYCELDDSIIWDRGANHLLPVLTAAYGPTLTALVFAHEFGHAIQKRLGIDISQLRTIDIESQADCAAGAFAAAALAGKAPHFHITAADLDAALEGFLQVRDSTPNSPQDISHGDGFDRLNALQQGVHGGAAFCFSPSYLHNRTYTERGYVHDSDYIQGGNEPLETLLAPGGLTRDLNRFWTGVAKTDHKSFASVKLVQADHPACGSVSPTSAFGYCPDDNTVYYAAAFAQQAYFSITVPTIDQDTGAIALVRNQPGDFALGMLISIGWAMAARHQFNGSTTTSTHDLTAAICNAGAYAEDINRADYDPSHPYLLSPPDMDEATSAVLGLVGLDRAYSARGTSGLQRVQAFVQGYDGGVTAC